MRSIKSVRLPVWAVPSFVVCICMTLVMTVIAMFTGSWLTDKHFYYSYELQAWNWLHGSLEIQDGSEYPWLELAVYNGPSTANKQNVSEIIYDHDEDLWYGYNAAGEKIAEWGEEDEGQEIIDHYYVSFPPFPSYVVLPLVAAAGRYDLADGWIAWISAMLACIYAVRLYIAVTGGTKHLYLWVLFLLLANGYVYLTLNTWVWFIAQNLCFSLMVMALYYAWSGKGGVSFALWACAVGCRPLTVLWFPLLAILCVRFLKERNPEISILRLVAQKWYWAIAPVVIGGSYMLLNWLRFGNVLEFGHNYLPEFTRTTTGQFNLCYLSTNLTQLLTMPQLDEYTRQLKFNAIDGNAFYLTTPLLVVFLPGAVYALYKQKGIPLVNVIIPVLLDANVLLICMHKTLGGVQFGNRYLVDVLPYVWFALLLWKPEAEWPSRIVLPLTVYGTVLHMIGTVYSYNNLFF